MFDIAYRDMSDTVPVGSFDFHVGEYTIVVQMAFGLAPRIAGRMKKPLVKVRLASGFSYLGYECGVKRADLVVTRWGGRVASSEIRANSKTRRG